MPNKVVDLKALTGDSSDNIPGVRGVGPKTAINLLSENGDLDAVYATLEEALEALNDPKANSGAHQRGAQRASCSNDKRERLPARGCWRKSSIDIPLPEGSAACRLSPGGCWGPCVSGLEELELNSLQRQVGEKLCRALFRSRLRGQC